MDSSLWNRCARALENELPESQFNTWVRPLQALEGDGALKLLAPNRFVVDWEHVSGVPEGEFDAIATYEVIGGRIANVWFLRP